jgi:PAS domain-containing protein
VPNGGLTEYVLRTGSPLLAVPDVFDDLVERASAFTRCALRRLAGCAAEKFRRCVIGALVVQTYTEGCAIRLLTVDLLAFVSTQVAQAIERKRSEQALRESEERYRTLIDNFQLAFTAPHQDPKGCS